MRRIFRLAVIFFRKMQDSQESKLSKALKNDNLWNSLTGTDHQKIGRLIARYNSIFVASCNVPVKKNYVFTDTHGNGIYR